MLAVVCDAAAMAQGHANAAGPGSAVPGPTWNALLVGCDVFGLLASILEQPDDDDVLLDAVVLAGALAGHASLAQHLADSGVVSGVMGSTCGCCWS